MSSYEVGRRALPDARDRLFRLIWHIVWLCLYRLSPTPLHGWRCFLLRLFRANIGNGAHPYPSVRVWAPWNLRMGERSCLASGVDCYNVSMIELGADSIVSQRSFLCSASHDYQSPDFSLISGPIVIGRKAWVGAEVFVGPGVSIGDGAVIGARSVVIQDVPSWVVAVGHPTKVIRPRFRN